MYSPFFQELQIHPCDFVIVDQKCCTIPGMTVNMCKSFFTELIFHFSCGIPADTVVIVFDAIIGHTLYKSLITCNPLHVIIFQDSSDFPVSMFDQYPGKFIRCPCIRRFHTVKCHIFIMVMNKNCRDISFLNLFIQTDIRVRKCRA